MTTQMFGAPMGQMAAAETISGLARGQMMEAEAASKQEEVAAQRRFMDGMANMQRRQTGSPLGLADNLDNAAQIALSAGQIDKASKLSGQSALVRERMAQLAHTKMVMQEQQVRQGKNTINLMGQFLQGATDQASWDRGNTLFTMTTGKRSPYAGLPYSPELVEQIKTQAMTAKDLAEAQLHRENLTSLEESRKSAEDFRKYRMMMMEKELALRKEREARMGKSGGKSIGVPSKDEQMEAASMVTKAFADLPEEEVQAAAYTISSRAKALRQTNPGLDAAGALAKAFAEAQQNQDFKTVNRMFGIGNFSIPIGKSTRFMRQDAPWTSFSAEQSEQEDAE